MSKVLTFKSQWKSSIELAEELLTLCKERDCEIMAVILHSDNTCSTAFSDNLTISEAVFGEASLRIRIEDMIRKNADV